jgi:diaminopimelate decarboxylase
LWIYIGTDTFTITEEFKEIKEGDILSFRKRREYCYSMASNYNSRYKPVWMNGRRSFN